MIYKNKEEYLISFIFYIYNNFFFYLFIFMDYYIRDILFVIV